MDAPASSPDNSTLQPASVDNQTCDGSYITPPWLYTVIPAYIYTLSALGIVLNLLVLLVFLLHKKACTATEIYLSNMAVADLFLVVFLPFWGIYVSNGFIWTFLGSMCKIVGFLIVLNYNCCNYFLVLVSIDRFLALVHPLSHCKLRTRKYAMISCMAVWSFGLVLNIPTLVCKQTEKLQPYNKTAHYDTVKQTCLWKCSLQVFFVNEIVQTVVGFIVPLLIISFCTVKILQALKERPQASVSHEKCERKVTVLVLAVLIAFTICWLPYRVLRMVELAVRFKLIEESCKLVRVIAICQNIFIYFGFFNSDINPVLYVIVGKIFREKMWEVLSGCSSVTRQNPTLTNSDKTRISLGIFVIVEG